MKIKLTKEQAMTIAGAIIAILVALGLMEACTSSVFVLKGQKNKVHTEQRVKVDSTSVSINNK